MDRTGKLKTEHENLSQPPPPTQHPSVSFIHEATGPKLAIATVMRNKNLRFHVTCGCLVLLLMACSSGVSPTNGTLEGNTYRSQFFKFQVQIPQGWTIGNKQDFDKAVEVRNSGHRPDPKLAKEMDQIAHLLLMAMETPVGTRAESNPSIMLMVVDARSEPSIQTGKDYELLVIQGLKEKGDRREQLNEPFLVKLGSKEFYRVDFKVGVLDKTMHQAYFATIEKRCLLLFTVGADSEADVNKLLTVAGFPQNGQ